ncbi:hypothetical protein L484_019835 [Morus notabilis]|uniref:Uncharacterized protein n=1 Tax=Morus notabilis TaxID=981085 RepID=W9SHR6_9ROSA|nr:hypothetical protein L484_019835 [Morus notabilis]
MGSTWKIVNSEFKRCKYCSQLSSNGLLRLLGPLSGQRSSPELWRSSPELMSKSEVFHEEV